MAKKCDQIQTLQAGPVGPCPPQPNCSAVIKIYEKSAVTDFTVPFNDPGPAVLALIDDGVNPMLLVPAAGNYVAEFSCYYESPDADNCVIEAAIFYDGVILADTWRRSDKRPFNGGAGEKVNFHILSMPFAAAGVKDVEVRAGSAAKLSTTVIKNRCFILMRV